MLHRRLLVTGTALLLSILTYIWTIALIQPSIASAHAYVIGSDPVDGSTVVQVPKEVHIYFNAAVSPLSSAHVYFTQNGNLIDVGATPSQVMPLDARELVIPIKNPSHQPEGSYEVIWSALADGDGHTTEGIIGFNVGFSGLAGLTGTPILGPSTSNDLADIHTLDLTSSLAVLWEWFTLIALTSWIGILVMEQFVLMDGGRHRTALLAPVRQQTSSLQQLCLVTLLFGESIALLLRAILLIKVQQSDALPLLLSLSVIAETSYGHIWLLRMALIALAMGYLYWIQRSKSPRLLSRSTQLLYTGLLTLLFVLTDPDAQVLQPHFSTILFDWLKTIGQGIWFGSFAYLGYVLLPLLKTKNGSYDAEALATLLQRLTPVLVASISIQLLSLVFLSDASIHDPQQVSTDPYGFTLAVQWVMIVITALLTTYILFVLRPRMDKAQLSSALEAEGSNIESREEVNTLSRAEARATQSDLSGEKVGIPFSTSVGRRLKLPIAMISALGMGILLGSALMSFYAPPIVFPNVTYTNQSDISANAVNTQTKQIGPFSVTLELLPGHIDHPNTVIMLINDSHGKPVTDAQIQLAVNMQIMDMGTSHALITGGNPVYATTFDPRQAFNMAGPWVINVEIQRPNQQAAHDTFQVMLS
jgi:methionine-rich copper-binding protein CopC